MDPRLAPLAARLNACRRHGNRLTLEGVLESARILAEAKALARRDFGRWLRECAHMDRSTAGRHLRVAEFVRRNGALMQQISTLSLTKIYALSSLDSTTAVRLLSGRERLSAPLDQLSDIQFYRELRTRHPGKQRRTNRENVFRQAFGLLVRAEKALFRASRIRSRLTSAQRTKIAERIAHLSRAVASWRATVA